MDMCNRRIETDVSLETENISSQNGIEKKSIECDMISSVNMANKLKMKSTTKMSLTQSISYSLAFTVYRLRIDSLRTEFFSQNETKSRLYYKYGMIQNKLRNRTYLGNDSINNISIYSLILYILKYER